jgi:hypothetical protein
MGSLELSLELYPGRAPSVVVGSGAVRTTLARARLLRGT